MNSELNHEHMPRNSNTELY